MKIDREATIKKMVDRAARFEALAEKNNCPPGIGPALVAENLLSDALEIEELDDTRCELFFWRTGYLVYSP